MIKIPSKINIQEIKKILIKQGFKIIKIKKKPLNKDYRSFYFTVFASFILIAFFSVLPTIQTHISKAIFNSQLIENTSKMDFEKTLTGKEIIKKEDKGLSLKNLFDDIFDFQELPTDTVRLNAETLRELFKETKYNLKDVRKNKVVKGPWSQ